MKYTNQQSEQHCSAPLHSINIDFTHSSEPKLLINVLREAPTSQRTKDELEFLCSTLDQLNEAVELLESLEV